MSKKLHPLAAAIRAIDALSDNEKLALRDYLRPAPKPRQKTTAAKCKHCQKTANAAIHIQGSSRYGHLFEPSTVTSSSKTAQKRKAGKEASDKPFVHGGCVDCELPIDANVHQLPTTYGYHEYSPASESKAATGGGQ